MRQWSGVCVCICVCSPTDMDKSTERAGKIQTLKDIKWQGTANWQELFLKVAYALLDVGHLSFFIQPWIHSSLKNIYQKPMMYYF